MELGRATIINSTIGLNKAHRHGGAIYLATRNSNGDWQRAAAQYLSRVPALSVNKSVMHNNTAQANGGEWLSAAAQGCWGPPKAQQHRLGPVGRAVSSRDCDLCSSAGKL